MLALSNSALSFAPAAPLHHAAPVARAAAPLMETKADLEALATKLNPIVGFWCGGAPATRLPEH